jgi:hypothetical protein
LGDVAARVIQDAFRRIDSGQGLQVYSPSRHLAPGTSTLCVHSEAIRLDRADPAYDHSDKEWEDPVTNRFFYGDNPVVLRNREHSSEFSIDFSHSNRVPVSPYLLGSHFRIRAMYEGHDCVAR